MKYKTIADNCICCGYELLQSSPAILMPFVAKRVFGHEPLEITSEWGMRDLSLGTAYSICNSLQCQRCGALFLDYRFSTEQMNDLYKGYRNEFYTSQRSKYEPDYAKLAEHIQKREQYIYDVEVWLAKYLPKKPAVLDWGGGTGINTPFLSKGSVQIYDISNVDVMSHIEKIGIEEIKNNTYDLIVCSQVLEHVPYPLELLERIKLEIKDEVLLYIEVPYETLIRDNQNSLALAGLKKYWHEHINFFTEKSLAYLLQCAGMEIIDTRTLSVDLGWRTGAIIGVLAKVTKG